MDDNLSHQAQDVAGQFGFNWWLFGSQVFSIIIIIAAVGLPVFATVYCFRHRRAESQLALWLLLVWLVPIAGPICTVVALRRQASAASPQALH